MKKLLLAIIVASFGIQVNAQSLILEKTGEGVWIKDHEEKVLFYQAKTKSKDGKFPRANYIHPLYNVDGFELTEDFPSDHLHHRGIFWTWHQLIIGDKHIGDAWLCEDFIWDVAEFGAGKSTKNSLSLKIKTLWKSPLWKDGDGNLKPFVEERTNIIVYEKTSNYRILDFEISLLALEENVKIGGSDDHKGYGGFSVRMKMPNDIDFSSSTGQIEPRTPQIEAGAWMNVSGTLASQNGKGGIVIMNHPNNPMYPEKWILRKKGSMQNPVYPGQNPVGISTSKPTVLKYRLVVYKERISDNNILEISTDFQ